MAENNSGDEIVSLEELVKDEPKGQNAATIAGAPVPPSAGKPEDQAENSAEAAVESAQAPVQSNEPSLEEIEKALAIEDPAFAESLKELAPNPDVAEDIESLDLEAIVASERAVAQARGIKKLALLLFVKPARAIGDRISRMVIVLQQWRHSGWSLFKDVAVAGLAKGKAAAVSSLAALKSGVSSFMHLPLKSKLLVAVIGGLGLAVVFVLKLTLKDQLLPTMEMQYLKSFADVAEAKFTYAPDEPMEDFNNPLLHPEHVVLIERIITNIRSSGDGNPMALIEVFIEGDTKDAAIEIKDREAEARDVISRTLEQMYYEELSTSAGKSKLKNFIRKNVNAFLTKGRVRRVFLKSVVLKP